MIDAAAVRSWCLARPGVTEERPFGPRTTVFKVEGKVFLLSALESTPLEVSLKCEPPLAEQLRDTYAAITRRPSARAITSTSAIGTPCCATARCPTR